MSDTIKVGRGAPVKIRHKTPAKLHRPSRDLSGPGRAPWPCTPPRAQLAECDPLEGPRLTRADVLDGRYTVDFAEPTRGRPGLPWRNGKLYLEHHPDLVPVKARGLGSDPGEFWRLRSMPQGQEALADLTSAIVREPHRLEAAPLPEWFESNAMAVAAHKWQTAACNQLWDRWCGSGNPYGFERWAADVLLFAKTSGFYLGEITGKRRRFWLPIELGQVRQFRGVELLALDLPDLRAPWTVEYWLTQCERPVGVVQRLYQSQDYDGFTVGEVVLPWDKLIHIPHRPAGPTDLEGQSFYRGAYAPLLTIQDLWQVQALTVEVNGFGTWIVRRSDPNAVPLDDKSVNRLTTHLKNYKSEHVPYMLIPHGYEVELLSPQQAVPDFSAQVDMYERAAERALNQGHKGIATRGTGAYSARSDASRDAREGYDFDDRTLICRPIEQLLRRFIEINFPHDVSMGWCFVPSCVSGSIETRDREERARTLATYATAGLLDRDAEIKRWVRDQESLPAPPEVIEQDPNAIPAETVLVQGRLGLDALHTATTATRFAQLLGVPEPTPDQRAEYWAQKQGAKANLGEGPEPPEPRAAPTEIE